MRSVVVHLHLYQPPREDPWLGEIEREPEAAPDHDWTARVERTSYRALAAARVLDAEGRVRRVVETFAHASFDAAPTLLAWMADQAPATYAALLAADRASRARLGHGNALAHPYDHAILPLLSRRDKATEVRWGIADFRRRFGREPDGMWCPETAVDDETLDVLAEHGLRFTIVAPHQLTAPPPDGRPGRYRTAAGREIALLPYDDALARAVAFGPLLRDGRQWARRMAGEAPADGDAGAEGVTGVATVAETYGHHHPFGEMALAAMLEAAGAQPHVQVENFASLLARRPAAHDVTLVGASSWSCPHGVERWRRDCGCHADPGTSQRWRAPLRAAVDALQQALDERFARDGQALFGERGLDPWAVRDAYLADGVGAVPDTGDAVWARELLEMAREGLRLHTSGAWYGDTVDRPEVRTMLRHAARALALAGPHASAVERAFVQALDAIPLDDAGDAGAGAGATVGDLYVRHARPALPAAVRVAAGWAAVRAVGLAGEAAVPDAWRVAPDEAAGDAAGDAAELVLVVADRRLGAPARFAVRVDVPGPAGSPASGREPTDAGLSGGAPFRMADVDPRAITILVRPEGGHALEVRGIPHGLAVAVKLADVPERARRAVELALRRAVVHRLLDPDERALLAAGEATLAELVEAALVRAVQRLALDASPAAQARVHGLVDLAESTGGGTVPTDAQTMLARVRAVVGLDGRQRLAPVAWRLGFSTRAWLGEDDAPGLDGPGRAEPG